MKITLSIQNNGIFNTKYTYTYTHTHTHTYITYTHTQELNICTYIYNTMLRRCREIHFYICYFSTIHCALWLESIFCPTRSKTYEVSNNNHMLFKTTMGQPITPSTYCIIIYRSSAASTLPHPPLPAKVHRAHTFCSYGIAQVIFHTCRLDRRRPWRHVQQKISTFSHSPIGKTAAVFRESIPHLFHNVKKKSNSYCKSKSIYFQYKTRGLNAIPEKHHNHYSTFTIKIYA